MKPNKELIKAILQDGWRQNQTFSVHKFLISEATQPEVQDSAVDALLAKLDKATLKSHMNINGNITDSGYEED